MTVGAFESEEHGMRHQDVHHPQVKYSRSHILSVLSSVKTARLARRRELSPLWRRNSIGYHWAKESRKMGGSKATRRSLRLEEKELFEAASMGLRMYPQLLPYIDELEAMPCYDFAQEQALERAYRHELRKLSWEGLYLGGSDNRCQDR